jgi:hypothetical protein
MTNQKMELGLFQSSVIGENRLQQLQKLYGHMIVVN